MRKNLPNLEQCSATASPDASTGRKASAHLADVFFQECLNRGRHRIDRKIAVMHRGFDDKLTRCFAGGVQLEYMPHFDHRIKSAMNQKNRNAFVIPHECECTQVWLGKQERR